MIEAKDLRIGNLVRYTSCDSIKESCRGKFISVDSEVISWLERFPNQRLYEYIPITEELMLQFCFEAKIENTGAPIHEDIRSFKLDGYEFSEDCNGEWFLCGYNWNTKHFKYVHQLQNLFYALTQTDLTFTN